MGTEMYLETPNNSRPPCNTRKLAHDVAKVGEDQPNHHHEGDADSVFFPDQVAEALAGNGAHAGTHLLNHDQRDDGGQHGPQQQIAKLRAGGRIGPDAVGIVVDIRGDEARPHHGKNSRIRNFQLLRNFMRTGYRDDRIGKTERSG